MTAKPLTPKQQRFVDEYLIDLNGTAAYQRAGYAARTDNAAAVGSADLLRNPKIAAAISSAQREVGERAKVKAADVLKEAALVAFSDIGEILDFTGTDPKLRPALDIPASARRAIASFKVKRFCEGPKDDAREVEITEFKFWPKTAAIEQLMRHLGLHKDRDPLEVLLATLPAEIATAVRRELGQFLQPGGTAPGGPAADAADGAG